MSMFIGSELFGNKPGTAVATHNRGYPLVEALEIIDIPAGNTDITLE
jgi:hypothetical protein